MKKIKLRIIDPPRKHPWHALHNRYSMFIHRELTLYYSSRKEAEAVQNSLNSWANDIAFILNEIYITAWTMFRRLWFYYDYEFSEQREIFNLINRIEKCFYDLFNNYTSPGNGGSDVFRSFELIIEFLDDIFVMMDKMQRSRNNWEAIKLLQYERDRLRQLKQQMENWPNI